MQVKREEITQEKWDEMKKVAPGTIRYGRDIGKTKGQQPYTKYIWLLCQNCGGGRWSQLRKELPALCQFCASQQNMSDYIARRGHPYNWKGGRKRAGDYIRVLKPEHSRADRRGYILEHVAIWEGVHNRPLPTGWIIHHLNGITTDNRPENLAAFPSRKHQHVLATKSQRIRELEAKVKILEKALDENQMIYWGEN